jgi:hypothetical protein
MHSRSGWRSGLIWLAFAGAVVLTTAPVWQRAIFGFNPTLDQLSSILVCRAAVSAMPA